MAKISLLDGKSYNVSEVLGVAMRKALEEGAENVIYHDKTNGAFQIKFSNVDKIELKEDEL